MALPTGAATYHVATSGNDANPGTSASPFRTIQRAANVVAAGDTVYIRAGTYRETVNLNGKDGSAGSPIVFAPDPANTQPVVVSGADPVTVWAKDASHASGMVYKAAMAWNLDPDTDVGVDNAPFAHVTANQVFVNGRMMLEARWPNSTLDVSRPDYAHAASAGIASNLGNGYHRVYFEHAGLTALPGAALAGAHVHMLLGAEWVANTGSVHSLGGNRLEVTTQLYDTSTTYAPVKGSRFILSGKKELLDQPGEWWYDSAGQMLYLWAPSGVDPTTLTVEAKKRHLAFNLAGCSYVTVRDLQIFAATVATTTNFLDTVGSTWHFESHSSNIVLDGLRASHVTHARHLPGTGIQSPGNPYADSWKNTDLWSNHLNTTGLVVAGTGNTVRNCVIGPSAANGIAVLGHSHLIENNVVHDCNYLASDAANINCGASNVDSLGHVITANTVYSSGRGLVLARPIRQGNIHHNHLFSSTLQATDGGGIYSYGHNAEQTAIAYNRIQDIVAPHYGAAAIYMDERAENFLIHHNLIYNSQGAVRLNQPRRIHLYNNTLVGALSSLGGMGNNGSWLAWNEGGLPNYIRNNIFTATYEFRKANFSNNVPNTQNPAWNSYSGGPIPLPLPYDNPPPNLAFANAANGDYTLQSGSAAIGAGATGTDNGVAIPAYEPGGNNGTPEAGAFEYGRTAWTAGSSLSSELLPAPTNLRLTGGGMALAWDYAGSGHSCFVLERSTGMRYFDVVATLPPGQRTYTDAAIATGRYFYRIRADHSPYSPLLYTSGAARSALATMEAEFFDSTGGSQSGVVEMSGTITQFDTGDWVRYSAIQFPAGVTSFVMNVSPGTGSDSFDIRLGGPTGTLVATITVNGPPTGWGESIVQTHAIAGPAAGTYDLYLVSNGATPGNIDWFRFGNGGTPPAAPTGLTETSGQLAWTDNAATESGFKVEQSSDNITWLEIAKTGANVVTYAATPGSYCRVRAYNAYGNSAYSNVVGGAFGGSGVGPAAPSGLAATALSESAIRITWTDNATTETGFELQRSLNGTDFTALATPAADAELHDDSGLSASTRYHYRLRAVNGEGSSAWAGPVSAMTVGVGELLVYEGNDGSVNSGTG